MRKSLKISIAVVAALGAVSAIAVAAGGRHHHFRHGGGFSDDFGGGRHALKRLAKADADKDGAVSLQEFLKTREERFTKLDKNADGSLDADELTASMREKADHRVRMMIARLDADGDGKVTKDEAQEMRGGGRGWGHKGWHDHGWRKHDGDGPGKGWRRGSRGDDDRADVMDDDDRDSGTVGQAPVDTAAPVGATTATPSAATAPAALSPEAAPKVADEQAEGGRGRRGWHGGRRGERLTRMFKWMDANADGVIDKSDLDARANARVDYAKRKRMHVLDKDRDGKVSKEEFSARPKQRFADLDLDSDGKISSADLPPRIAERWQKRMGGDNR